MTLYNNENKHVCLCIPRVEKNTSDKEIKTIIDELSIGIIDRIDMVPNRNKDDKSNRAFIHFHSWDWNERTNKIYEKLTTGKPIKVIYNNPWFWKLSLSRSK